MSTQAVPEEDFQEYGVKRTLSGTTFKILVGTALLFSIFQLIVAAFHPLSSLVIPGLQGMMTRRVSPQEQGQLQGANQSMNGVASMVGPLIFGLTFAWSVRNAQTFPVTGLAILIAAAMMAVGFILALRTERAP